MIYLKTSITYGKYLTNKDMKLLKLEITVVEINDAFGGSEGNWSRQQEKKIYKMMRSECFTDNSFPGNDKFTRVHSFNIHADGFWGKKWRGKKNYDDRNDERKKNGAEKR